MGINNQNHLARYTKKSTFPASKFTSPQPPNSGSPLKFNLLRTFGTFPPVTEQTTSNEPRSADKIENQSEELSMPGKDSIKERDLEEDEEEKRITQDEEDIQKCLDLDTKNLVSTSFEDKDGKFRDEDENLQETNHLNIFQHSNTLNYDDPTHFNYDMQLKEISSDPHPISSYRNGFSITLHPLENDQSFHKNQKTTSNASDRILFDDSNVTRLLF